MIPRVGTVGNYCPNGVGVGLEVGVCDGVRVLVAVPLGVKVGVPGVNVRLGVGECAELVGVNVGVNVRVRVVVGE